MLNTPPPQGQSLPGCLPGPQAWRLTPSRSRKASQLHHSLELHPSFLFSTSPKALKCVGALLPQQAPSAQSHEDP